MNLFSVFDIRSVMKFCIFLLGMCVVLWVECILGVGIELPEWMKRQIHRDLEQVSELMDAKPQETMRSIHALQGGELARLVLISIQNGKTSWETEGYVLDEEDYKRLDLFLEAIDEAHALAPLPDIEFLVSLSDSYDRPLFLSKTYSPVFTLCKSTGNHKAVLIPSYFFYPETMHAYVPWEQKEEIALWRGGMTGEEYFFFEWDLKPRSRLVLLSKRYPEILNAYFVENNPAKHVGSYLASWLFMEGLLGEYMSPIEQSCFRYLIAVDGATTPRSMSWQLFSQSVLLKGASSRIEWFYGGLLPYVHYVEFDSEKEDVIEKIYQLQKDENLALCIAQAAYSFAKTYLQKDYALSYLHTLLTTYDLYKNRK